MNTRKAEGKDLEIVLKFAMAIALQHQAFDARRFCLFPDHLSLLREYFAFEISSERSIISLLVIDDKIVGFSFVKMEDENLEQMALARAWLCDIYVDNNARQVGGGKLLIEASRTAAIELGSKILMLHVANNNKYARDFFNSVGFEETMTEMLLPL